MSLAQETNMSLDITSHTGQDQGPTNWFRRATR